MIEGAVGRSASAQKEIDPGVSPKDSDFAGGVRARVGILFELDFIQK